MHEKAGASEGGKGGSEGESGALKPKVQCRLRSVGQSTHHGQPNYNAKLIFDCYLMTNDKT